MRLYTGDINVRYTRGDVQRVLDFSRHDFSFISENDTTAEYDIARFIARELAELNMAVKSALNSRVEPTSHIMSVKGSFNSTTPVVLEDGSCPMSFSTLEFNLTRKPHKRNTWLCYIDELMPGMMRKAAEARALVEPQQGGPTR